MQTVARTAEARTPGAVSGAGAGAPPASWAPAPAPETAPRRPKEAPGAFEALERLGARRAVRRGQDIYAAGDPAEHCFRVVSGCVRTVGLDAEGRRHVAEFLLPGDLFGLDAFDAHHLSAEAVADTVLARYPRRAVEALAERHGAVARGLRDLALQSLRRAHGTMFLLGRKTAGERVAAFLLAMAARAPSDGACVDLPMTRADIADHLGLTVETVSRNMARLRRDGAIAAAPCGVRIRDRRALEVFGTAGHACH